LLIKHCCALGIKINGKYLSVKLQRLDFAVSLFAADYSSEFLLASAVNLFDLSELVLGCMYSAVAMCHI